MLKDVQAAWKKRTIMDKAATSQSPFESPEMEAFVADVKNQCGLRGKITFSQMAGDDQLAAMYRNGWTVEESIRTCESYPRVKPRYVRAVMQDGTAWDIAAGAVVNGAAHSKGLWGEVRGGGSYALIFEHANEGRGIDSYSDDEILDLAKLRYWSDFTRSVTSLPSRHLSDLELESLKSDNYDLRNANRDSYDTAWLTAEKSVVLYSH